MLPAIEPIVQYGLLGIFGYLVVWGTIKGYPRLMDSHDNQINKSAELVKHVLVECTKERQQEAERFERHREVDLRARHEAVNKFQLIIADFCTKIKIHGVMPGGE